ncbi:TPA: SGNH/GDSL hydrolase family protein [Serratia marcescens]
MAKTLPEFPNWVEKIFQLETNTPVLGGPNGPDNWQAQQLASRTSYLKGAIESMSDYREYTFYTSPSDPDGTLAGIAGTPEGKVFRVAIPDIEGDTVAFNYYKKSVGLAVFVNSLPSSRSVIDINQALGIQLYDRQKNINGYYVVAGGVNAGKLLPTTSAPTVVAVFPVIPGQTYNVSSSDFRTDYFAMTLKENEWVTGETLGLVKLTGEGSVRQFTVPADSTAKFAFMNVVITTGGFDISHSVSVKFDFLSHYRGIQVVDAYARNRLIDDSVSLVEEDGGQLYSEANNRTGYFVRALGEDAGKIQTSPGTALTFFPISAGKTYIISASDFNKNFFAVTLKADNQLIGPTLGLVTLAGSGGSRAFTVPADSTAAFAFMNVVIPNGSWDITNELVVSGPQNKVVKLKDYGIIDVTARKLIKQLESTQRSVLTGKSIAVGGDSITAKNFRTKKNYHEYISDNVGGMTIYNYGISGSGYYDRYDLANSIAEVPDYITLFFGTNDWGMVNNAKPLGTFGDTGTVTISGCINTCMIGVITKFFNKKIGVITPLPRANNWGSNAVPNAAGYTLEQLVSMIQRYADHYSLPCLDLYHESNLPVYTDAGNRYYFTYPGGTEPDGLHPNDEGHIVMAAKIQAFLETL